MSPPRPGMPCMTAATRSVSMPSWPAWKTTAACARTGAGDRATSPCGKATPWSRRIPGYLKDNSHGEFVFDHAWATAYARHGLDYFPKWLGAVPYSPVTGPRLLARDDADRARCWPSGYAAKWRAWAVVGPHQLPSGRRRPPRSDPAGCCARTSSSTGTTPAGWRDFDAFLAAMDHKHRKNIRQERAKLARSRRDLPRSCMAMRPAMTTWRRCTASTCRPSPSTATRRR